MKFRNLTIGRKILAGFALVFVLFVAVAGLAYLALGKAGSGLAGLSTSAEETNRAANLEAAIFELRMDVQEFLATGTAESVQKYQHTLIKVQNALASTAEATGDPTRATELNDARGLLAQYNQAVERIVTIRAQRDEQVTTVLEVQSAAITEHLRGMLVAARQSGDQNASFKTSTALQQFYQGVAAVNGFLLRYDPAQVDTVRQSFAQVQKQLDSILKDLQTAEALDASLADPEKKKILAQLGEAVAAYSQCFDKIVDLVNQRAAIITGELDKLAPQFSAKISGLRATLRDLQNKIDEDTRSAQRRNEWLVFVISVVGLATGLVTAWIVGRSVSRPIQQLAQRLTEGATHTAGASSQVTAASKTMADGASRQAATLEETSASLEEMAAMTKRNAENAQSAKGLANQTRQAADAGTADMKEMQTAMQDIQTASGEISKIIKTIDEIAFQTNILALNAAVEAARAGAAGAGFAVVADEVRNLAQRSAQAARETAQKIDDSISKSERGAQMSNKVAKSLDEITGKARQVDELIAEIATASTEQSQGIAQVVQAVGEMDRVTQGNAATAEETSAAAAELDSQAGQLKGIVAELTRMVEGAKQMADDASATKPATHAGATASAAGTPAARPASNNGQTPSGANGRNGHGHHAAPAEKPAVLAAREQQNGFFSS
ncbi:MAG TPA: methyl-accepting chemotaxis protein [Opitutaceae bacterium]